MLELQDVTLLCVDCDHPEKGLRAIRESMKRVSFGKVRFLTGNNMEIPDKRIEPVSIKPLLDAEAYSRFMIGDLYDYVATDFVLFHIAFMMTV